MHRLTTHALAVSLALSSTDVRAAHAQFGGQLAPPPTRQQCRLAIAAIAGGSHSDTAEMYGSFVRSCGQAGTNAVAAALIRASAETDTSYLRFIGSLAAGPRSPILLVAAESVAINRKASLPARVTALLTLLAQFDPNANIAWSIGYAQFLSPAGADCKMGYIAGLDNGPPGPPQSASALRGLATLLDSLSVSAEEPLQVRTLARCVRRAVSAEVPYAASASQVKLTYVCGSTFKVTNHSIYDAELKYRVKAAKDSGELTASPDSTFTLVTDGPGELKLLLGGRVIASAGSTFVPCR